MVLSSSAEEGVEILGVVVDKKFRRLGIAQTFLEIARNEAKELGFASLSVKVFEDNKGMLSLLKKNGYAPYKTVLGARWDGENLVCLKTTD